MRSVTMVSMVLLALGSLAADYPISSVEMSKVRVTGGFWFDRIETNRTATLISNWNKCTETPRIANFTNAALRTFGKFGGIPFDDSDVYKMIEGTAYILAEHPDKTLTARMKWLVHEIAKAQEPDGYLYTARTLGADALGMKNSRMMGPTRWSHVAHSHELYNVGHLYEAAVAWKQVSGEDELLRVAEKNARLVCSVFGPGEWQLKDIPGHPEIELALCKLYRQTGKAEYLGLAKHFIDMHGRSSTGKTNQAEFTQEGALVGASDTDASGSYCQNHRPFAEQRTAVGHAVRAGYFYCGAADVAALTGDGSYITAIDAIWENIVGRKMHLTGGIGARPKGEKLGDDYELPNEGAYLETCAAIGNALFNDRMFRRTGKAKYMDVLERIIYNGFASGISLTGDRYFYPNPLASKGGYARKPWFNCSCCPVNDIRFIPQIPSFAYATDGKEIYVNLFIESEVELGLARLSVKTDYPWSGKVSISVAPVKTGDEFTIKVRVPGWARGEPVPSDLYAQTDPSAFENDGGYLVFRRKWRQRETIDLDFPMPVKRIRAHAKVAENRGLLAVEKGPIVWCAEGVDNGGKAYEAKLPANVTFADDTIVIGDKKFPALRASNGVKLIPYCLWGNRQPGNDMRVWFGE